MAVKPLFYTAYSRASDPYAGSRKQARAKRWNNNESRDTLEHMPSHILPQLPTVTGSFVEE